MQTILNDLELENIKETCEESGMLDVYNHFVENINNILHIFLLHGSICLDIDGDPRIVEDTWFSGGKALRLRFELKDEDKGIPLDISALPPYNSKKDWLYKYELSEYCSEVIIGRRLID